MRGVVMVALFQAVLAASPASPPRSSSIGLGAWITYWDLDRGLERIGEVPASTLEDVFLFSAALAPDGDLVLVDGEAVVREAVQELGRNGRRVWLTVVNDVHPEEAGARPTLKDGDLVHRLLSEPSRRTAHREDIVSTAQRLGVAGIDVDYENLAPADRDRFTAFIAELSVALRRERIRLSVTVQPKHRESRSVGPGAADWSALCPLVERLQVMLYNQHSGKTGPGPIATREWMSRVLGFANEECDDSRIVPILKLSGMEWSPAGVRSLHYEDCVELARQNHVSITRDESDHVPRFSYTTPRGLATVFFEDATSIEAKFQLIRNLGFTRTILWSVGREDPEILPQLTS